MKIEIFNVNHGQCAAMTAPNGRRMLIDCGDRVESGRWWAPSMHYCGQYIDLLALMNLDEDHLSDYGFVQKYVRLGQILSNPTVGAGELHALKQKGMQSGTAEVYRWMANPYKAAARPLPDFGAVRVWWYYNPYIPGLSDSTNNLSLVLFIQYGLFKIVFSGDMEEAGWREMLLRYPQLARDLAGTSIFVASHHGRESGCCTELFDFFRPEIVVISDAPRQYDSQDTDDWYRQRCLGAVLIANPFERRYVMTTRGDGDMILNVALNGAWTLVPVKVQDWDLRPQRALPMAGLGQFGSLGLLAR